LTHGHPYSYASQQAESNGEELQMKKKN